MSIVIVKNTQLTRKRTVRPSMRNMDGVLPMKASIAAVDVYNNVSEDDLAKGTDEPVEFANAEGDVRPDEMCCADGSDDDFYNARGGGLFSGMRARKKQRQARRDANAKSKNQARLMKAKAKQDLAKSQIVSAKAALKGGGQDAALLNQLNQPATDTNAGMSMGAKIGIGVGVAVVLGIVGFIIYKKTKKK